MLSKCGCSVAPNAMAAAWRQKYARSCAMSSAGKMPPLADWARKLPLCLLKPVLLPTSPNCAEKKLSRLSLGHDCSGKTRSSSGSPVSREFPGLRVFPAHVGGVIQIDQQAHASIQKSHTKNVAV